MKTAQEIILELRADGLSQSEIARELRIPQARISRWEHGDVPDSVNDGLRLAAMLAKRKKSGSRKSSPAAQAA